MGIMATQTWLWVVFQNQRCVLEVPLYKKPRRLPNPIADITKQVKFPSPLLMVMVVTKGSPTLVWPIWKLHHVDSYTFKTQLNFWTFKGADLSPNVL
jgi:hypothetical protein